MPLFKVQNNVPEVYVNQSRDFQLLCRAYDSIVNGVKFDIDSMLSVINTDECNSRLLPLLQTKLGFISDVPATNDALRYVLKAFPHIVKNKGSLKAIQQAVIVFLKINHIRTPAEIHVTHKDDNEPFVVKIGIIQVY